MRKLERANRSSGRSESKIAVLEWSVGGPVAVLDPAGGKEASPAVPRNGQSSMECRGDEVVFRYLCDDIVAA